jgi:hypothetical protein
MGGTVRVGWKAGRADPLPLRGDYRSLAGNVSPISRMTLVDIFKRSVRIVLFPATRTFILRSSHFRRPILRIVRSCPSCLSCPSSLSRPSCPGELM